MDLLSVVNATRIPGQWRVRIDGWRPKSCTRGSRTKVGGRDDQHVRVTDSTLEWIASISLDGVKI